MGQTCQSVPNAICTNNYCGGCHAIFTLPNGEQLSTEQCAPSVIKPSPTLSTTDSHHNIDNDHDHTMWPTSKPVELCGKLHDHCTSAHPKEQRCCNPESMRCYYHKWGEIELFGHKVGECCVRPNRFGCTDFDDCCGDNKVCHQGYCLRADDEFMGNALIITDNGKWADWSDTKEEVVDDVTMKTYVFGLSKVNLIGGIVIFCVCCNTILCCVKRGTNKNIEHEYQYDIAVEDEQYFADNAMSYSDNYKKRYVVI